MTAHPEFGLLRFFRARVDETAVLNDGDSQPAWQHGAAGCLALAAAKLRSAACAAAGGTEPSLLQESVEFQELQALTRGLAGASLERLGDRQEQLAFWLNVYNALTVHAVVQFGLSSSIRQAPGFFRRAAYRIGGLRFSAEAIEHGILRGNRPPLPGLAAPFDRDDPRLGLVIQPPDVRVHFALNCATRSCPIPRAYSASEIDAELEEMTRRFVADTTRHEDGRLFVSELFSYYREDFGDRSALAGWLPRYLSPDLVPLAVTAFQNGQVAFDDYDWTLSLAGESARE